MRLYLFFSGFGTLFFFVAILLLFRSPLFFFVLFVILFLLSFLGGRLLCSVILLKREKRQFMLNTITEGYTARERENVVHSN